MENSYKKEVCCIKKKLFLRLAKTKRVMSKKDSKNEELIVDVEEVYSRTETFVEENKNTLTGIVALIVIIVGGYFAYQNFYVLPMEEEAQIEFFNAEKNFKKDSLNLAIYGDGLNPGFIEIADEYSGTKVGNLAHYYLGASYLKLGQFESAISELEDFSSEDYMLGTMALGMIGDAYMELGDLNKAVSYYDKAANRKSNEFSSPIYLMKAGRTYELIGNYNEAVERYETIKDDFPKSSEAGDIEKMIARAESFIN